MFGLLLQDWTTIQAGNSASLDAITQSEPFWLDVSPYRDLVAFLQVSQFTATTGNLYIAYQTSPTKDENLFTAMNDIVSSAAVPISVGVLIAVLLRDTALCPLCHWLRWQLSPGTGVTSYEITFRLWLSASCPGALADATMGDPSAVNDGFEGDPAWTYGPTVGGSSTTAPAPLNTKNAPFTQVQMNAKQPPSVMGQKFLPAPFNPKSAIPLPQTTKQRAPGPSQPVIRYSSLPPPNALVVPYIAPGAKVKA